jgi:ribosomal protein S6--L-glutamate ligase
MKRLGGVGIPKGWSTMRLVAALAERGVEAVLIDMARVRLDLTARAVFHGEVEITGLDAVIVKKIAPSYSPDALDRMEILRLSGPWAFRFFPIRTACIGSSTA